MRVHATTLFYKEEQLFEIINNDIIQNSKSGARAGRQKPPLSYYVLFLDQTAQCRWGFEQNGA